MKPSNAEYWEKRRSLIRESATIEWPVIQQDPDTLALVMLYWGEGTKRQGSKKTTTFKICNTDPGVLAVVKKGLIKLGYVNLKLDITISSKQSRKSCKKSWENYLGLKVEHISVRKANNKTRIYSKFGLANITVRKSFELSNRMSAWIDCCRKDMGVDDSGQLNPGPIC